MVLPRGTSDASPSIAPSHGSQIGFGKMDGEQPHWGLLLELSSSGYSEGAVVLLAGAVVLLAGAVELLGGAVELLAGAVELLLGAVVLLLGAVVLLAGAVVSLGGAVELLAAAVVLLAGVVATFAALPNVASAACDARRGLAARMGARDARCTARSDDDHDGEQRKNGLALPHAAA
ncbi:unnamed protein product [Closterium sp. Naga37s-1]|nr:unnamed protein product [Closterium sp. Naga37s-1]